MKLTDEQRIRLEENIVRFIRNIPYENEVTGMDWIGGLQIDNVECIDNSYLYTVNYSWEDEQDKLHHSQLTFRAKFLTEVVEDIVFV